MNDTLHLDSMTQIEEGLRQGGKFASKIVEESAKGPTEFLQVVFSVIVLCLIAIVGYLLWQQRQNFRQIIGYHEQENGRFSAFESKINEKLDKEADKIIHHVDQKFQVHETAIAELKARVNVLDKRK